MLESKETVEEPMNSVPLQFRIMRQLLSSNLACCAQHGVHFIEYRKVPRSIVQAVTKVLFFKEVKGNIFILDK